MLSQWLMCFFPPQRYFEARKNAPNGTREFQDLRKESGGPGDHLTVPMNFGWLWCFKLLGLPSGYVKIAIENGH